MQPESDQPRLDDLPKGPGVVFFPGFEIIDIVTRDVGENVAALTGLLAERFDGLTVDQVETRPVPNIEERVYILAPIELTRRMEHKVLTALRTGTHN